MAAKHTKANILAFLRLYKTKGVVTNTNVHDAIKAIKLTVSLQLLNDENDHDSKLLGAT